MISHSENQVEYHFMQVEMKSKHVNTPAISSQILITFHPLLI